jgi:GNAT superfamily N-acetyltransferase
MHVNLDDLMERTPLTFSTPTPEDLVTILREHARFWGERDIRHLHQALFVRELGDTALVTRNGDGEIVGYLFGFVAPVSRAGYVHLVATRDDVRGQGVGRLLYERFERLARERGAVGLKAITTPGNRGSIAFHERMGFRSTLVDDYSGPGQDRVVFWRDLEP